MLFVFQNPNKPIFLSMVFQHTRCSFLKKRKRKWNTIFLSEFFIIGPIKIIYCFCYNIHFKFLYLKNNTKLYATYKNNFVTSYIAFASLYIIIVNKIYFTMGNEY